MRKQSQLERIEKLEQKVKVRKQRLRDEARAQQATADTFTWVTSTPRPTTSTGSRRDAPSPYEPFPPYAYFRHLFNLFELEPIVFIEKSRDMTISWACVAYLTLHAMRVPCRGVIFQTQKYEKAI
jgi:hypothetical protein